MLMSRRKTVVAAILVVILLKADTARAETETVVDSEFSRGGFAALGWKAKGDWDVFTDLHLSSRRARPGGQQDLEGRRSDFGVQGRWPVR
jgi:hypothetical protein